MQTIGLCITELEPGGAERAFVQLAIRANRSGRFQIVVYVLSGSPKNPVLADQLDREQVQVRYLGLNAENKWRALWQLPAIMRKWRRFLVQDQIVLLQSFLFHANYLARKVVRRIKSPSGDRIITVSGYRVCEPRIWQNILDRLTRFRDTAGVAVSEAVRDYYFPKRRFLKRRFLKHNSWLCVIPNGVDASLFCPEKRKERLAVFRELGVQENSTLILSVGRLTEQKNFAFLIQGLAPLLDKNPDWYLAIVGEGEGRTKLTALIQALNMENRILLTGYRSDTDRLLAAADLFVLTSRWEGLPNVALEAAASGLPIVALSSTGVAALFDPLFELPDFSDPFIEPDRAAQIVAMDPRMVSCSLPDKSLPDKSFSKNSLSDRFQAQVSALLQDKQNAQAIGQRNRQRVINYFDWNKMIISYENLWQNLLITQNPLDNNPIFR